MRRTPSQQSQWNAGEMQPPPGGNPEMWVQLGIEQHQRSNRLIEEQQQQTRILLHTVQQLQEEMERVRQENAMMMQERERILKILSDKQNQRNENPSADREH